MITIFSWLYLLDYFNQLFCLISLPTIPVSLSLLFAPACSLVLICGLMFFLLYLPVAVCVREREASAHSIPLGGWCMIRGEPRSHGQKEHATRDL